MESSNTPSTQSNKNKIQGTVEDWNTAPTPSGILDDLIISEEPNAEYWNKLPVIDKKTELTHVVINHYSKGVIERRKFQRVRFESSTVTWSEWCLMDGNQLIRRWAEPEPHDLCL